MMNGLFRKYGYFTIVAILAFVSASFAQTTTSMTLNTPGNGTTLGDVYVDPYTATVGGVSGTTVICDDWSNNSYLGESWTAYQINAATVSNPSLGTPMWGNNQSVYNELAYLGSQLLSIYNPTNPTAAQRIEQTELSFAIWQLTWNSATGENPQPLSYLSSVLGGTTSPEYQQTLADIQAAQNNSNYSAAGWEILTPEAGTSNPAGDGLPQEFLVYTPESSTMVLFGADMIGLLALAFFFRRRVLQPIS